MATHEICEYTTRWWKNDNTGDVSVAYEVDGQTKWSVIPVNSVSELGVLVDLIRTEKNVSFDDEENYLRTSTSILTGSRPPEDAPMAGMPTRRAGASRSATDPTDPRCLRRPQSRQAVR